jgi:hypothetical protein
MLYNFLHILARYLYTFAVASEAQVKKQLKSQGMCFFAVVRELSMISIQSHVCAWNNFGDGLSGVTSTRRMRYMEIYLSESKTLFGKIGTNTHGVGIAHHDLLVVQKHPFSTALPRTETLHGSEISLQHYPSFETANRQRLASVTLRTM